MIPAPFEYFRGLDMYYEIHGKRPSVLLLHCGTCTIDFSFASLIPVLAKDHKLMPEQQAHGRTKDVRGLR